MIKIKETCDFLILGAGLTGLAAASSLGDRAIVLEKDDRAGGLVKTECLNGYWFDRVIHLLYFKDPKTESDIRTLLGDYLSPLIPEAWVETSQGVARFPLQTHLGHLSPDTVVAGLIDFIKVSHTDKHIQPQNFRDFLLYSFGHALCDLFFFPYNRKMWKRPLKSLAPSGFQWNIARPDLKQVLQGAIAPDASFESYNDNGWYPRPPKDANIRGMEYLSQALAKRVSKLRFKHTVVSIDTEKRQITAQHKQDKYSFFYRSKCLATLPLPQIVQHCVQAPKALKKT